VILDMNGVLLVRGARRDQGRLRPHLDALLSTLFEELAGRVEVAVWSSMMYYNLHPLVEKAFGHWASKLKFVWDQSCCTQLWVPEMRKPLLRKDLVWLKETEFSSRVPDHVMLIDDDPIKCTENDEGTAVHPKSFKKAPDDEDDWDAPVAEDDELLRLAAYIKACVNSGTSSARRFVLQNPFEEFDADVREGPLSKRRASGRPDAPDGQEQPLEKGEIIEAYWPNEDRWMVATVTKVWRNGTVTITWDEDGSVSDLSSEYIRKVKPVNPWVRMSSRRTPGCYYYYNKDTGESQLEPPPPWEIIQANGREGMYYYRNAETGKTSFSKPELSD